MISEKTLCSKGFTNNLRDFYMKIIATIIPTDLVTNSLLRSYKPKQESGFQQVGGLVMRYISAFYL